MPADDKHEDPVEHSIHDIMHGPGYRGLIICNAQGIMIRYEGFDHNEALILTSGIIGMYNSCQNSMKDLMGPEDGVVENVRLKCASFELICTQRGEFTFMVKQSFIVKPVGDEEAGEAKAEEHH
jgi:hypothetical protein